MSSYAKRTKKIQNMTKLRNKIIIIKMCVHENLINMSMHENLINMSMHVNFR